MARPIVLIPHLFRLADAINFRKNYSPPLVRHLDLSVCLSVWIAYASLADGVTEEANDDLDGQDEFGGEYREFNAEDPNYQQEFAEDADGGKSNLFPL